MKEIFSNESLNKLHLHHGLIRFAESTTTVFGIIMLYKMGFPFWYVFLLWSFVFFSRSILRLVVPYIIHKFGLKNSVYFGNFLYVFLLPVFFLASIDTISVYFYLFFFSLTMAVYWYSYHIVYGLVGDSEKRGRQSAVREAYARLAQAAAPLLAGFVMDSFGANGVLMLGTVVFVAALVAFFPVQIKEVPSVSFDMKQVFKNTSLSGFSISALFAFAEMFFLYAWLVVVFLLFSESSFTMGTLLAIALVMRVTLDYFVGKSIDLHSKKAVYIFGAICIAVAIILRSLFGFSFLTISAFELLLMLGYSLFFPYESVLLYNSIKESKHPEWFALFAETGWDWGTALAGIIIAVLLFYGFDLRYVIFIGLITLIPSIFMFKYYFHPKLEKIHD